MKIAKLTVDDVKEWTSTTYYSRGHRYYNQGAIQSPQLLGSRLTAKCAGSYSDFYEVWVELDENEIIEADCSCPIGDGGYCKHAVALLLTWVHQPEKFGQNTVVVDGSLTNKDVTMSLADLLNASDKKSLAQLLHKIVKQNPELYTHVFTTLAAQQNVGPKIDENNLRQQVEQALKRAHYMTGYEDDATGLISDLQKILTVADSYQTAGRFEGAMQITCVVMNAIITSFEDIEDYEGLLPDFFTDVIERIALCLPKIKNAKSRWICLKLLTTIDDLNFESGDVTVSNVLLDNINAKERTKVANIYTTRLESSIVHRRAWPAMHYGEFLIQLIGSDLSDANYMEICKKANLKQHLVTRLLEIGSVSGAIDAAKQSDSWTLTQIADEFVHFGYAAEAEALIDEHAQNRNDHNAHHYIEKWKLKRAEQTNNWQAFIAIVQKRFQRSPNKTLYSTLKTAYAKTDLNWLEAQEQILAPLIESGDFSLLARIHLIENRIEDAIRILPKAFSPDYHIWDIDVFHEVAEAAKKQHPHATVSIYRRLAKIFINNRGRDNYKEACRLLKRCKAVLFSINAKDEWRSLISDIKANYAHLPALIDEIKKAKLLS